VKPNYPGYLLPDNPQPEGYICLKVFIPDAPEYLYAFSGAYQFFGKWLAWERDEGNNATLAAAAWREAINKTFLEAWLNCGEEMDDCCEQIEEILTRLEELENMNINVNCGGGCGCSQAVQCLPVGDVAAPPDTLPPNPFPSTPTPTTPSGLLWKCNMAHYSAYLIRLWGINSTVSNGVPLILSSVEHAYDGLGYPPPALAHTIAVSGVATMLNAPGTSDMVVIPFDANYDAIVCAMFNAATTDASLEALQDIFAQVYDNALVGQAMSILATLLPLEVMFTPGVITTLPPSYRTRTCDCAAASPVPLGGEWWLIPVPLGSVAYDIVPNAGTGSVAYAVPQWTMSPLLSSSFHEVAVQMDVSALIAEMNSAYGSVLGGDVTELHGATIVFLTNQGNVMDGWYYSAAAGGSSGFTAAAGQQAIIYNSTTYGAGGVFADLVDLPEFDGYRDDYGNSVMDDGKASFNLNSYNVSSPASVVVKLWYICKVV